MNEAVKKVIVLSVISCLIPMHSASAEPIDKEKAVKAAQTFLKIEQMREEKKAEKLSKEGKKILSSIKRHKSKDATPIYDKNGMVLVYVTELEPEGYIVTSADDRINPIIAYSFRGNFPFKDSKDNVLLHILQWDMEASALS